MVVVMAVMAAITGVLAVALTGALKLERASAGDLDRLGSQRDLADRFRADVAQAADAPEHWREDVAGPTCLILARGEDRHLVYRWEAGRLERFETVGQTTHRSEFTRHGGPADVAFERSRDGGRLITLRLFAAGKDGRKQPSAEIAAALGGDLQ
jgi:hypothetical protein